RRHLRGGRRGRRSLIVNKVIAVARREMQERAFVFVTAIGITLAPLLALAVPRGTFDERLSAFAILSLLCACNFTLGLSAILGASLVGRELTEKRMSFYFSRPLSASSIWFGKLTAAIAMILGCAAILFPPSLFMFRESRGWTS